MSMKSAVGKWLGVFLGLTILNYVLLAILYRIGGESLTGEIVGGIKNSGAGISKLDVFMMIGLLLLPSIVGASVFLDADSKRALTALKYDFASYLSVLLCVAIYAVIKDVGIWGLILIAALLSILAPVVEPILVIIFKKE